MLIFDYASQRVTSLWVHTLVYGFKGTRPSLNFTVSLMQNTSANVCYQYLPPGIRSCPVSNASDPRHLDVMRLAKRIVTWRCDTSQQAVGSKELPGLFFVSSDSTKVKVLHHCGDNLYCSPLAPRTAKICMEDSICSRRCQFVHDDVSLFTTSNSKSVFWLVWTRRVRFISCRENKSCRGVTLPDS